MGLPVPSAPASAGEVQQIRSYLEQHRDTYDREALRRKLLSDGHSPQAVDLAFAQAYGLPVNAAQAPSDPPENRAPFLATLFGVLLLNFVASCLLTTIMFTNNVPPENALLMAVLIPLELAIMAYFWRRNRPVARGFMWALIGSLPVVAMGLLLGFCVAIINAS